VKATGTTSAGTTTNTPTRFKVEATQAEDVIFSDLASKSDTDDVLADLADITRRASEGVDFLDLAKTYSDVPVARRLLQAR
jgi:hypothetical protein